MYVTQKRTHAFGTLGIDHHGRFSKFAFRSGLNQRNTVIAVHLLVERGDRFIFLITDPTPTVQSVGARQSRMMPMESAAASSSNCLPYVISPIGSAADARISLANARSNGLAIGVGSDRFRSQQVSVHCCQEWIYFRLDLLKFSRPQNRIWLV